MKKRIFVLLATVSLLALYQMISLSEIEPRIRVAHKYCSAAVCCPKRARDYCAEADRAAADAISSYQDPSEAKNRDEVIRELAELCRQQNPNYPIAGIKRTVVQNKVAAFVS